MTDDERFAARYPCTDDAREIAAAVDVHVGDVITGDADPVDCTAINARAHERVAAALTEGTIGRPSSRHRVELLSYPVARVLVSLLDDANAIGVYADAEAAAIRSRIDGDVRSDESTADRMLDAFGLDDDVRPADDGYEVAVASYLPIATAMDAEGWALSDRAVADGWVPIERTEVAAFLERAAGERVRDGLPVDVPPSVRESVVGEVESLAALIRPVDAPASIDGAPSPEAFPPCVRDLLRRSRADAAAEREEFVAVAFLAALDLDAVGISALLGTGADRIDAMLGRIRAGDACEYVTPSCAGMQAADLCPGPDETCETIEHPSQYYVAVLDEADRETTPQGGATS